VGWGTGEKRWPKVCAKTLGANRDTQRVCKRCVDLEVSGILGYRGYKGCAGSLGYCSEGIVGDVGKKRTENSN